MEITLLLYTSLAISFPLLIHFIINKVLAPGKYRLPPSPAIALPILGHLHLLKPPLHRSLHRLSQITGPIFSLKLGVRNVVVVSSPNLIEECFTKNDVVLANRPRILVNKYIGYKYRTMSGANYGDHWRSLRRIAAQELLSTSRINVFLNIRKDEIKRLLLSLHKTSSSSNHQGFSKVEMRPKLTGLTFNVMMRMIAGKRYFSINDDDDDDNNKEGKKFRDVIYEVFAEAQATNPQDFLPFLQWIDYGGFTKKLYCLAKEMDELLQGLVDEHRLEKRNTMIGHLLSLQETQPLFYSDQTIKGLVMSMLFAGTDTSSITLEWAISLLLNHPDILKRAKQELDTNIRHHCLIDEEDLSNLPYLRNIILETIRLFPPAPLLIPHESSEDCKVGGYDVPRGTILFANAWAIHRDPELWEDATSFKPERFEGKEVDPHKLMPFGMGRRVCPGIGLANRMLGLALGSLLQCFEWERVGSEEVDLAEGLGLTMPKLKPLEVMYQPRDIMNKIIQEATEESPKCLAD